MRFIRDLGIATLVLLSMSAIAQATELTIHLTGSQPILKTTVRYHCDGQASRIGLPSNSFPVEYMNGAGNSLAIIPVQGRSLIFANVTAGSGARYVSGSYLWWEAAGSVTFSSDSIAGKALTVCQRVR